MGALPTDRAAAVHPGADSRRAEVRKILGHPCRCGKARRPAPDTAAGNSRSDTVISRRAPGQRYAHAFDEYPLPSGTLSGSGGGYGGGSPAGHRSGGIPLFQRSAGTDGAGNGALSHQCPHGSAAVRLSALCLRQPLFGAHPAGPFCPAGGEYSPGPRPESSPPSRRRPLPL